MEQHKLALVTGGGQNLGAEICRTLAAKGFDIAIIVREDLERARKVAEELKQCGVSATAHVADVADPQAARRCVREVLDRFGTVDVLVNAAAIRPRASLADTTDEAWARVMAVNLSGPFYMSQAVAPTMTERGDGVIINISGLVALQGGGGGAVPIAASKAGLIGLTRALADELGPKGIRANVVIPARMETVRASEPPGPKVADEIQHTSLRRIATTDDVASVVAFLAGDEARFITGQSIHVNGGFYKGG